MLLQASVLAILFSHHGFSPHPAQSLHPLAVTLPPRYLLLSFSFLASSCISSSSPPGIQIQTSVSPRFSSRSFVYTEDTTQKSVTNAHNFHPHPFLIFVLHIQSPAQMQLVQLFPPLWMPFLPQSFSLTQLQRHAAEQLVGFFLLCL